MCGIAGIILKDRGRAVERTTLDRMTDVLAHRGPDDRGVEAWGNVGFGNRRLAVIDLEGGHQPMPNEDGTLWLTYNGELYNYLELRTELMQRGYRLRTHSDTEVLLYLYDLYGTGMLERMNGMFAFALYDRRRRRVLLARDRFGEKPLYVYEDGQRVLFASEIKALLAGGAPAAADTTALHEYLTFQYCLHERTLFRGVRKVEPAEYVVLDDAGTELERGRYWTLGFEEDHASSEEHFVNELRFLLEDAVKIRLRSDVAVGAYLSGGLDSSVVASLAAKLVGRGLPTFTGFFDEPGFSELEHARAVAAKTGGEHHVVAITPDDFVATFQRLIYHLDEPAAGPGAFPQLLVSQLARGHVTVVLGGQGGDEIFGGYARYLMLYLEEAIKGAIFESQDPERHLVTLDRVLPHLSLLQTYVPLLKQFWSDGLFEPMERRYFALVTRTPHLHDYLAPEFLASRDDAAIYNEFEREFNDILEHVPTRGSALFNRMTAYDARTMLQSLLHVEDRMSMAVSLESRLPLLDHRIAELMFRMPPRFKYDAGQPKAALRKAAGTFVPTHVLERKDKMGFPVPFVNWSQTALRDFVGDVLLGERARSRGVYRSDRVERLIDSEFEFGRELWGLLSLETWFQTFVDAPAPVPAAAAVAR